MLIRSVASVLIASVSLTCLPVVQAQQIAPQVIVPAGTVIPLTLVNPIKSKSTKPGDTVRASVAFPVTVGDQVAIPVGTYVEGTLGQPLLLPKAKPKHQPDPVVQIHFTRIVFANGYSAPLDATQAATLPVLPLHPTSPSPTLPGAIALMACINSFNLANTLTSLAFPGFSSMASSSLMVAQAIPDPTPTLPPAPHVGPGTGTIIGLLVGIPVTLIILGILFHHRSGNPDFIVHDAGWQFQMKLAAPLSLDTSQVATKKP